MQKKSRIEKLIKKLMQYGIDYSFYDVVDEFGNPYTSGESYNKYSDSMRYALENCIDAVERSFLQDLAETGDSMQKQDIREILNLLWKYIAEKNSIKI